MNTSAFPADPDTDVQTVITRLGFAPGLVVQEFGWDEDADNDLRFAVEDTVGSELEDEDWTGGADAVLLWWRLDDGDLTDALVDTVGLLGEGGFVILLTPRPGHEGSIDPADVREASRTAGLHDAAAIVAGPDWRATRLATPRNGPRR